VLASIGRAFIGFLDALGKRAVFCFYAVINIVRGPFYPKIILKHIINVGYFSLPVIGMTAVFTGAVLALQSYTGFSRFSGESAIAIVVVLSITRELGPVLAALMLTSRMGASMAAEIATMRVTEQIDALITLDTDPIKYLVTPRVIASVLMMPCLVIISDIIGIMGGYLVAVYKLGFNEAQYLQNTFKHLELADVMSGVIKSIIFAFIISLMSCYAGFHSNRGAQGVGDATTSAVVSSSILILLLNYLTTFLLFSK
jgi:phospholipid/cholesterol/gamma-HCH transport system permease protein